MARERLEDFGILSERLGNLMDSDAFEYISTWEGFSELYKADDEKLAKLFWDLQKLKEDLSDCWSIARWGDDDV